MNANPATPMSLAETLYTMLRPRWEAAPGTRLVVGIAGESGSGKSVTADTLAAVCRAHGTPTLALNQDNYFLLPPRTNHEHRCESLANVGPHEVNLALLAAHIAAFRAGERSVQAPLVDYPGNRFATQTLDMNAVELLVVEGTYVLQMDALDVRIFLQATHRDTEERRRIRNRDIDAPIVAQVLAIEHDIIARQAALADILIDASFNLVPQTTSRADVEFTTLIQHANGGDREAAAQLFAAMYHELHTLAQRQLARNGGPLTLGATTLLHEVYLNIADRSAVHFADRGHFMGYAARAMRGLIIDYARSQRAEKRGGAFHITGIGDLDPSGPDPHASTPLDALGDALDTLAAGAPALAGLVDLHFFCGFSFTEIAEMRAVSERTVQRDWRKAKLLLYNFLGEFG